MDLLTFLTVLAFFLTIIAIVAIAFSQTRLAEKVIDGLVGLPKPFHLNVKQKNLILTKNKDQALANFFNDPDA